MLFTGNFLGWSVGRQLAYMFEALFWVEFTIENGDASF